MVTISVEETSERSIFRPSPWLCRPSCGHIVRHRFHDGIWALASECGYRPRLCRPYRPQTKGKVERSIDYIANSFFHPLVTRCALER